MWRGDNEVVTTRDLNLDLSSPPLQTDDKIRRAVAEMDKKTVNNVVVALMAGVIAFSLWRAAWATVSIVGKPQARRRLATVAFLCHFGGRVHFAAPHLLSPHLPCPLSKPSQTDEGYQRTYDAPKPAPVSETTSQMDAPARGAGNVVATSISSSDRLTPVPGRTAKRGETTVPFPARNIVVTNIQSDGNRPTHERQMDTLESIHEFGAHLASRDYGRK